MNYVLNPFDKDSEVPIPFNSDPPGFIAKFSRPYNFLFFFRSTYSVNSFM